MRIVRLGRAALDAEAVRLRYVALRTVRRVVLGAIAGVFGLVALAALHVAAFFVLELDARITPAWSAVIVAGGDLLLAVILLMLAARGGLSAGEIEARIMRDRTISELRTSLAFATFTGPAARLAGRGAFGVAKRVFRRRR